MINELLTKCMMNKKYEMFKLMVQRWNVIILYQ